MTETELLDAVKIALKELSTYNDSEILLWVRTAKTILYNAGVKPDIVESEKVIGIVTVIVDDLRLRKNVMEDGNFTFMITQLLHRR